MPPLKIFDTTFLIDLVKGDKNAIQKAKEIDAEGTLKAISVVTVHEYLRGIYYLFNHDKKLLKTKLEKAEAELIRFEILPYTYETAKTAAEIDAQLALNGQSISFSDTIIAATALHYKLTLVTRNTEHFSRIPNLQIETY
ncbi:MAG: type II toxin-antitoxin system VapC family toxin [Candidatus Bathyarchaeia archaeon]